MVWVYLLNDNCLDRSSNNRLRVEELKKHFHNGKLSRAAVYAGVNVLGLCKDEWKHGVVEDAQKHKEKFKYKVSNHFLMYILLFQNCF